MNTKENLFGGKIVILAGDFRQCLPVIKNATQDTISQCCNNTNNLWANFTIKRLKGEYRLNMIWAQKNVPFHRL